MGNPGSGDGKEERLPRDVRGLLNWATRQQQEPPSEAVAPMEPERAQWLEEALKSMTVDDAQRIKEALNRLQDPASQAGMLRETLQNLQDIVDNLDNANDLQLLGGWPVMTHLLRHEDAGVRAAAAEVIATSVQNFEKAQNFALRNGTLGGLLALARDPDATCRKKAVLGLSTLVREFPPGQLAFIEQDGVDLFKTLLTDADEQVRTKSLFFLRHVCAFHAAAKDTVREAGLIPTLVCLVADESASTRELALAAIVALADGSDANVAQLRRDDVGFRRLLETELAKADALDDEQKEARREEFEHMRHLLGALAA